MINEDHKNLIDLSYDLNHYSLELFESFSFY